METLIREVVVVGFFVVTTLACLGTLLGCVARWSWLGEVACHFRLQYAWTLGIGSLLLGVTGALPAAVIAGAFAVANILTFVPLYRKPRHRTHARTFRFLLGNVQASNRAHERLLRLIREADPDVIVLQEVDDVWLTALQACEARYPFRQAMAMARGCGIAFFSRLPVDSAEVVRIGTGPPSIVACLQVHGRSLLFIATHPLSPLTPRRAHFQRQHFTTLAGFIRHQPHPAMVLGDFNTTSWSPVFQEFLLAANLRDSRVGFGLQPTWPVEITPLRIPLDHCVVSPEISVRDRRVGPDIGSDHYPLIVDCSWEPAGSSSLGRSARTADGKCAVGGDA